MSWKCEIKCRGSENWTANALRFATEKESMDYGHELFCRWFGENEDYRAAESEDEVNYIFTDNHAISLEEYNKKEN